MKRFFAWLLCVIVVAFGVSGCSSDTSSTTSSTSGGTSGTPTGGTQYKGTFAGKGEGGAIDVNVANNGGTSTKDIHPLTTFTVTGTIKITGGATAQITGTFDDATGTLTITGGGYTFTGKLSANGISGTYSGPNGSGAFSVLSGGTSKNYCGTYGVGTSTTGAGVWNFTINGSTLVGSFSGTDGQAGPLSGTVTGDKVDINAGGAKGTVSGDTASGTYDKGSWAGKGC